MFDYKLIEALAMVAREGSFEKAARALYVTQSAVSQRIKLLEEHLGQIVIARTTPPRLTAAGRQLLKHYLQVKRLEDDLVEELGEPATGGYASIAVGINADSLALWFLEALSPFLREEKVLLEIRVADQDQTHRLLKDGEVMGCISSEEQPMQGCRSEYLGQMTYRMMATPEFAARWFPTGFQIEEVRRAPALVFDRKDDLHYKFLQQAIGEIPASLPQHYVPSVEKYAEFLTLGIAYGMVPDQQSRPMVEAGTLVDVAPDYYLSVKLFWHCWSLKSKLLESFTRQLVSEAKTLIDSD